MEQYRHIDTAGLPPGFDVADLIESGVTDQELIEWCKARVRPGPPSLTFAEKVSATKRLRRAEAERKPLAEVHHSEPVQAKSNVVRLPEPVPVDELDIPPEFSEDSLAEEFTRKYQKSLCYCATLESWYYWDENRWQKDDTALAVDLSRKVCREMALLALDRTDLGSKARTVANAITSRRCFSAVEGIARSDRRHVVRPAQFDADPWILNTPTGIVDLTDGATRAAKRDDWCVKQTKVGPGGECPTWHRFLQEATSGDADLVTYLQRIAGYCLTGSVSEQKFFFVYGSGGSGKGTYANTLMWLLNSYGCQANMDTFTEQKFVRHASEIAYFQGARMVVASETNSGQRWNEARIKGMTGGDPITANRMRTDPFTFFPSFKLLFIGNHKPHLKNVDAAIKRRLYMIPFENSVPDDKVDQMLPQKLHEEAGGILSWALQGCIEWQRDGLRPPQSVVAATSDYFEAEDRMQSFLDECCEISIQYKVNTSRLFDRFTRWAEGMGEYAGGRKGFIDMITAKGMRSSKLGGEQIIEGVRIAYKNDAAASHEYEF